MEARPNAPEAAFAPVDVLLSPWWQRVVLLFFYTIFQLSVVAFVVLLFAALSKWLKKRHFDRRSESWRLTVDGMATLLTLAIVCSFVKILMVILALIPHHAAYTLPYMQPLYAFYLPATFYGLNLLIIAVLLLNWIYITDKIAIKPATTFFAGARSRVYSTTVVLTAIAVLGAIFTLLYFFQPLNYEHHQCTQTKCDFRSTSSTHSLEKIHRETHKEAEETLSNRLFLHLVNVVTGFGFLVLAFGLQYVDSSLTKYENGEAYTHASCADLIVKGKQFVLLTVLYVLLKFLSTLAILYTPKATPFISLLVLFLAPLVPDMLPMVMIFSFCDVRTLICLRNNSRDQSAVSLTESVSKGYNNAVKLDVSDTASTSSTISMPSDSYSYGGMTEWN